MLISTRGRYALRIMIDLASNPTDEWVPLRTITDRQDVSEKYLESIVRPLSKADLLAASRGKGGGYKLNRKPEDYTVSEILRLVDSYPYVVSCLSQTPNPCERAPFCKTLPMWQDLQNRLNAYFDGITLKELASDSFDFSSLEFA